ncbi:HEAT repeat domain-containing protein, partial [Armatimonas sp.]|uniref:HEAT repeat domain-containing protein n=1 Tax=Armatimonas sp. TaxID=1872638 RepID=UPI0037501AE7
MTTEQRQQFHRDGYVILPPNLPALLHAKIQQRLAWVLKNEGNPGNNILPAIPELQAILDAPELVTALTDVLGAGYMLHPHRFAHNNEPAQRTAEGDFKAGAGTHAFIGWHQDSHSPLSRPRHYACRYAMVLYYPQDTPKEHGPTQLIPGTHYNRELTEHDYGRGFQAAGPAGTCVLVHFDIAHGGSLNVLDQTRYMVKFVFLRTEEPEHFDLPTPPKPDEAQIPTLISALNGPEPERFRAIYALAALGEPAVTPLCAALATRTQSAWQESATVMDDAAYALAALGTPAVASLTALLDHPSEWVQINASFALGEMGKKARAASDALIAKLRSTSHATVRTVLDALGQLGADEATLLPELRRLLLTDSAEPSWQEPLYRKWTGQNQVRVNAISA